MQKQNRLFIRLLATSLTIATLTTGCQSAPSAQLPQAPANIPSNTLTAFTPSTGYVYIGGQWKVLSASATHDVPSSPFTSIEYSPSGILTAKTVGGTDNSFISNEISLWMYDGAWTQVAVNSDKMIAEYAWSPANVLYAAPDDGLTPGIWMKSPSQSKWKQVPGSIQFGFINTMQFSPSGNLTITYQTSDGAAAIAQYDNGSWNRLTDTHVPFASDGLQLKWSPTGALTVGTSQHGVWTNARGAWTRVGGIKSPIKDVTQIGWSPTGQLVISGDTQHAKGLWQLANGQWSQIGGPNSAVAHHGIRQFGWSPNKILTVSDNTTGDIDQYRSGKWIPIRKKSTSQNGPAPTFQWSPTGVLTSDGGVAGGLWSYHNGTWTEVGGPSSPIHNQIVAAYSWS